MSQDDYFTATKKKKAKAPVDEAALRRKSVELLARREYSYGELEKKLLPLTDDEMLAYNALDWLVENGLQSDERFAVMYVRSKALSGYGPIRIRLELQQKAIKEHLIEQAFSENEQEVDWLEEVDRQIQKKAKNLDINDPKDKNKIMGYMQRRGFNLDQIYAGLSRYQELLGSNL